ncbi:TetR/AcrR family transcriptional regulator [Amycolatopsis alkalitolerans]|uniref:TetR/AcrR family transcriptional regulator n=1 Tax=Amycolatopsis alkalitolerans TaxID=2547244 RepID=A0A5C4LX67_9PSEU|nr:TetR/AcrR family transcriptional regulator [Amycolatopsis alkalitolerans]TNC23539.1 TetR/AcrR family transcriptional regulator [Amycolatopsis alkalitolerans]
MVRLTRAETQERNRAKVLAAAREEFAERGFRDAKVDLIAERAELTRGAVYSNFPGKRALYFAVLADLAERASGPPDPQVGRTAQEAIGAFGRAWVARLDERSLGRDLIPEALSDDTVRGAFAELMEFGALLLALSWERLAPPETPPGAPPARLVRAARIVLTTLQGASWLTAAAPGFVEPFDMVSACEQLAGLALNDHWSPPPIQHLDVVDEPWTVADPADGVVAVLGLRRLSAAEQALRMGADVTVVVVASEPAELMPLARWMIAEVEGCLRQAFPGPPRVRVLFDETGALAAAAGADAGDTTELAVRLDGGRIVARASGPGACHAVTRARARRS